MEKNASYTFGNERIHTNGAQLAPMIITKESGEKVMMWVVDEFNDDSFKDGRLVYPKETADNIDDLIDGNEMDDDDDF